MPCMEVYTPPSHTIHVPPLDTPARFLAPSCAASALPPLARQELSYGITDSGCSVLVVDQERLERLAPHLDALHLAGKVIVVRAQSP
jgi:hypothetical protein